MKNYSLSIYRISINLRNDRNAKVILCDFDDKRDILAIIGSMLETWKTHNHKSRLYNDKESDEERRVSRIRQDGRDRFYLNRLGRYLSGIIESGEYGTEESIIDSDTGYLKYMKGKNDAPMVPFYFMINIPENSPYGYLILERIGNIGIHTILTKAIREYAGKELGSNYVLNINPFMLKEVFEENMSVVSEAKKVILRGVSYGNLSLGRITDSLVNDTDVDADIVYKAGRDRVIDVRKWFNRLFENKRSSGTYVFENITCADIAFELKIGDKVRTVSIARIEGLGTNMDITYKVRYGSDGYPDFASIERQANILMSYIRDNDEGQD